MRIVWRDRVQVKFMEASIRLAPCARVKTMNLIGQRVSPVYSMSMLLVYANAGQAGRLSYRAGSWGSTSSLCRPGRTIPVHDLAGNSGRASEELASHREPLNEARPPMVGRGSDLILGASA